ncbi:MAG: Rho termination factor N-terminal domain-containing protein, partial [Anaerolineae bacterium]
MTLQIADLESRSVVELREMAKDFEVPAYSRLKKADLVYRLMRANAERSGLIFGGGVLEIIQDGIGFLRSDHLRPGTEDVYVSQSQIRRFRLRTGDMV